MKTIAVDFDGVLHGYSKKWQDGTIYDEPVPGAKQAMESLMEQGFRIVIYSTRCHERIVAGKHQPAQYEEMEQWLEKHRIPFHKIHTAPEKPLCCLFIDDNAYRFRGDWEIALNEIKELVTP